MILRLLEELRGAGQVHGIGSKRGPIVGKDLEQEMWPMPQDIPKCSHKELILFKDYKALALKSLPQYRAKKAA